MPMMPKRLIRIKGMIDHQPKKYPQILANRVGGERAIMQVKTQIKVQKTI